MFEITYFQKTGGSLTKRIWLSSDGEIHSDGSACVVVMPALTKAEQKRLRELRQQTATQLVQAAADARVDFVQRHAERLAARTGMSREDAERIIERQCDHVLLGDIELPFDDAELAGSAVADVLADPRRFADETLADPIEGVEYGRGKAKILVRHNNGRPFIHSFAHGGASYELRLDDTPEGVSLDDFWAYMPMHNYIYTPTRTAWPGSSVNSRVAPVLLTDAQGRSRTR